MKDWVAAYIIGVIAGIIVGFVLGTSPEVRKLDPDVKMYKEAFETCSGNFKAVEKAFYNCDERFHKMAEDYEKILKTKP